MSLNLETINANDTIQNIQTTIVQTEALGFELISLAKGIVQGRMANVVTFHHRTPGDAPGELTLVEVPQNNSLRDQEINVNTEEQSSSKRLISYAAVLVNGQETMVAAYRQI